MATGLGDAMVTGAATIEDAPCRLAVMDFSFMGGSMGSVVGEKFARACERAAADGVPSSPSRPRAALACRRESSR